MFLFEGIVLISLGLFSWSRVCAGPLPASAPRSLHMKPLLHIYVIPEQQDHPPPPPPPHISPLFLPPTPFPLFQMQNKHQASQLQHF